MESIPSGAGANRYVNENLHVKEIYTKKFSRPRPYLL